MAHSHHDHDPESVGDPFVNVADQVLPVDISVDRADVDMDHFARHREVKPVVRAWKKYVRFRIGRGQLPARPPQTDGPVRRLLSSMKQHPMIYVGSLVGAVAASANNKAFSAPVALTGAIYGGVMGTMLSVDTAVWAAAVTAAGYGAYRVSKMQYKRQ